MLSAEAAGVVVKSMGNGGPLAQAREAAARCDNVDAAGLPGMLDWWS
jgi:hypothetical protein